MRTSIDLNCDMGEDPAALGRDVALLELVSSANIACGGHAGDERTIAALIAVARERGVAVGAHPSYPDRRNFGRMDMMIPPDQLEASISSQIGLVGRIAREHGLEMRHVKPHGALYHSACTDMAVAEVIAVAVSKWRPGMRIVAQTGCRAAVAYRSYGLAVSEEAFADRVYEPDGTLRARSKAGAMIDSPAAAADQALRIARGHVCAINGQIIAIRADTICVHSDTAGAIEIARTVRGALEFIGLKIQATSSP